MSDLTEAVQMLNQKKKDDTADRDLERVLGGDVVVVAIRGGSGSHGRGVHFRQSQSSVGDAESSSGCSWSSM